MVCCTRVHLSLSSAASICPSLVLAYLGPQLKLTDPSCQPSLAFVSRIRTGPGQEGLWTLSPSLRLFHLCPCLSRGDFMFQKGNVGQGHGLQGCPGHHAPAQRFRSGTSNCLSFPRSGNPGISGALLSVPVLPKSPEDRGSALLQPGMGPLLWGPTTPRAARTLALRVVALPPWPLLTGPGVRLTPAQPPGDQPGRCPVTPSLLRAFKYNAPGEELQGAGGDRK